MADGKASDRALKSLEERGGAVWAFKRGEGSLFTLTYAGKRDGGVVVRGEVTPDMHRYDPVAVFPAKELAALGWRGRKREWVLRSDMDRADLLRTVEESVELLAPAWGNLPSDYPLVYRPAGEEDAGYGLLGCLLATISSIVGACIGALVAFVGHSPLPLDAVGIFAASVGLVVGFFVFGSLAPRVLAMLPATRTSAGELTMNLMGLAPGLIALATWLLAAVLGLDDEGMLLWLSVGVIVAMFVVSIAEPLVVDAIRWLSRLRD